MLNLDIDMFGKFRFRVVIILTVIFILLVGGCSLKKRYVGMKFNTENWAKYSSGEKITFQTNAAVFELSITQIKEDGEYFLEGTMDGSHGSLKSINHLVLGECRFSLLLSKNGVVVDNIIFFPIGTDHTHKLPFKKKFRTVPFDSVIISYKISVRG